MAKDNGDFYNTRTLGVPPTRQTILIRSDSGVNTLRKCQLMLISRCSNFHHLSPTSGVRKTNIIARVEVKRDERYQWPVITLLWSY